MLLSWISFGVCAAKPGKGPGGHLGFRARGLDFVLACMVLQVASKAVAVHSGWGVGEVGPAKGA